MTPTSNVEALTPKRPDFYKTTPPPHHVGGNPPKSFTNPWPSYKHAGLLEVIQTRWFSSTKNYVPVPTDASQLVPVMAPTFGDGKEGMKATWFGHASFLVEFPRASGADRGIRLLLDPVWSQRVGPYGKVGPVRFTRLACPVTHVPEVDAVCISHDHYDHLDRATLLALNTQQAGNLRYFIALGGKATLLNLGIGIEGEQITEMDWWDGMKLSRDGMGEVEVVCTPAQHRSGRAPWNFDASLWCSWVLHSPSSSKALFFAGDTGYCWVPSDSDASHHNAPTPPCPAFAEIGELYGPFDLALLPIGCFKPRLFMSSQHSAPEDSIAIHKDVKSKKSIGMHYGAFRGGISEHYEPVTEPPERWRKAGEAEGLEWGRDFGVCGIGETVVV